MLPRFLALSFLADDGVVSFILDPLWLQFPCRYLLLVLVLPGASGQLDPLFISKETSLSLTLL